MKLENQTHIDAERALQPPLKLRTFKRFAGFETRASDVPTGDFALQRNTINSVKAFTGKNKN